MAGKREGQKHLHETEGKGIIFYKFTTCMKKEDIMFRIDQLRKDKIIYATEAAATTLICIFGFFIANAFFIPPVAAVISLAVMAVALGYTLFMGIGNSLRLREIKKLERQLAGPAKK